MREEFHDHRFLNLQAPHTILKFLIWSSGVVSDLKPRVFTFPPIHNIFISGLRTLCFLHLLIIIIFQSVSAWGGGKDTLVDVTGVAVIVDELSASAREDGLKEEDIKALVERKLDKANIMLLEDRKWFSVFGGSYLLIKVIASKSASNDYYAVFLDVELYQTVVLFGKKLGQNITTAAATWSVGKLLSCRADGLKNCVDKNLSELTDMFIEDYLSVNAGKADKRQN